MDQGLLIGRSCFLGLAPAVMDQWPLSSSLGSLWTFPRLPDFNGRRNRKLIASQRN
jgi:hypothetical protein